MTNRGPRSDRLLHRMARLSGAAALLCLALTWAIEPASAIRSASTQDDQASPPTAVFVPAHRQATRVAVLRIEGEIDQVTFMSIQRRVRKAVDQEFDAIVLDIDTYGGAVTSAQDIEYLLKREAPINTVAWINPRAISAGTLISLSCREIVVHPDATWGDCAPIQAPLGMLIQMDPAERAKIEALLRTDVIDSGRRHGYDENLVQAFISVGTELWMLENVNTGERICVNRIEYNEIFGEDPPTQIASVTPPGSGTVTFKPQFQRFINQGDPQQTWTDEDQRKLDEQVQLSQPLPPSRDPLTRADRAEWQLVKQIISNDQLLTLTAPESFEYGFAKATIKDDEQLKAFFGAQELVRFNASWSEGLVRFLISWPVRAVLIVIFLISLFIETAAPGVGVFGGLAIIALLLLIGAPYLVGFAQWWEVVLIVIGMGLIAAEIFVIPGFGVAGVSGVLCLLVGMIGTFVSGDLSTSEAQSDLATGLVATLVGFFVACVGIWLLSRHVYEFSLFKRLVLQTTTSVKSDPEGSESLIMAMGPDREPDAREGDHGVADTDLRPAGRALINGKMLDVVTGGEYIPAGSNVRVTAIGRFRAEVEQAD